MYISSSLHFFSHFAITETADVAALSSGAISDEDFFLDSTGERKAEERNKAENGETKKSGAVETELDDDDFPLSYYLGLAVDEMMGKETPPQRDSFWKASLDLSNLWNPIWSKA